MRLLLAVLFSIFPTIARSQELSPEVWLLSVDRWGNAEHQMLSLERRGSTIQGHLGGWPLTGRRGGDSITFVATDSRGTAYRYGGTVAGGVLTGFADFPDINDSSKRARHAFTG